MARSQIELNAKLCKRCGICVAFCPKKVFAQAPGEIPRVQHIEACINCRLCEERCPDLAIEIMELASY